MCAINYPTTLDTTTVLPTESSTTPLATNHVVAHTNLALAVIALETKVGVDSSADTTTIDYKLKSTSSVDPGHKHTVSSVTLAVSGLSDVVITSVADGNVLTYNAASSKWINATTSAPDASTTVKGVTKLDTAPGTANNPIAVGVNSALLTTLSGSATSSSNKIVDSTSLSTTTSASKVVQANSSGFIDGSYLFNYQAFTSSGTWTKPAGLSGNEMVVIQVWGAGGSGGGVNNAIQGGGGGGGGGFSEIRIKVGDLSATETVTVAGTTSGTSGANGTVGGNSTFGAKVTGYGGGAGAVATAGTNGAGGGGGGNGAVGGNAAAGVQGDGGGFGGAVTSGGIALTSDGGGSGSTSGNAAGRGFNGGGGGAGGSTSSGAQAGGNSYRSGGGGGAGVGNNAAGGSGGTSTLGGAGGAGGTSGVGGAGSAPAGGGGGGSATGSNTTSTRGAGARGEVRVWVLPV